MKKLLLAISALSAALFSTAAHADISVSGSANAVYVDADGNSEGHVGGTVSFALSTTTDAGVTISAGAQITNDPDAAGGAGTASGMTSLTFGFANGTISVADDVAVPGTGKVGELVGHADSNQVAHTNDVALAFDDGSGISASTSVGDMTISGAYFYDGTHGQDIDGGASDGAGISLAMPIMGGTLTLASATVDSGAAENTASGASFVMPVSGGTLSLGVYTTDGDTAANEGEAMSVAYATTVGGASVSIGYTGYDANSNTSSMTDVVVSTSLGGGASIFAEYSNLTGAGAAAAGATTAEGVIAVGTSVSF
jgi:hypothetical protein